MNVDFSLWIMGAIAIVGIMEWAKGFLKTTFKKDAPAWAYALALPAVCFLVSFFKSGEYLWNFAGMWAVSQLGYALIIQVVEKRLKAVLAPATAEGELSTSTDHKGNPEISKAEATDANPAKTE